MLLLAATTAQAQILIGGNVYGGGNAGDVGGASSVTVRAGDLNNVFGGARMANVEGSALVNIDGKNASSYIIINKVFGGNDISGTIGSSSSLPDVLKDAATDGVDNTWNAFVHISTKTDTTGTAPNIVVGPAADAKKIYIGQLFGGGNGDYDYDSEKLADNTTANPYYGLTRPELGKAYLDLHGGSIVYAYGGGNAATVTETTVICLDNYSAVVNSIVDTTNPNADNTGELLTNTRFHDHMGINTGFSYPSSGAYQIGRLFGGNNKAEMAIRPVWHLHRGKVRNIYSGGNEGAMTHPNGILLTLDSDDLEVDNVYGGCRMADVNPDDNAIAEETINGVYFPSGYSARVYVTGGNINNVYGGNDVTGIVYGGNALGIHSNINGDVYGGGNGSYPYTDKLAYKDDEIYCDIYYNPGDNSMASLKKFRPNAESVSIRLSGTDADHPTIIGGAVYCGGNSATLRTDNSKKDVYAELKIGSYVIADKVFLGNNGANMITTNEKETDATTGEVIKKEGILRTMQTVNSTDLTDADNFKAYMDGVNMNIKPRVVFDDVGAYEPYSTMFGSFYCGGNVGSMEINGAMNIDFNDKVIVFEKLVGGSNDANVAASDFNAAYEGGLLGSTDAKGNKLYLNFGGLKIQPKRWKDPNDKSQGFEWNTYIDNTPDNIDPATAPTGEASADDLKRRLRGGNIYGGCYNSGHVNGNVVININASIHDRKGQFAIFDQVEENEGEAILYGKDSYNILTRRSGVILDEQGMDVLGKALNVFGGGFGENSEIWGSTTINLNAGYVFQVFGGGEKGVVGKPDNSGTYTFNGKKFKNEDTYSCYVNLKGSQEGVYRGHEDDSDDMAEAEFIYGGAFEAPIMGNTVINLGNGRIFNSFAGSCNADILGHTETYIGRSGVDADGKDVLGFPWVRDHVYGANDLGGRILAQDGTNFINRVSTDLRSKVHNPKGLAQPDVTKAGAYMEYIQGRVDYIFGGCYGDYDYKNTRFSQYTYPDGRSKAGFTKPRVDNAFVNFKSNTHTRNETARIFGAGQGRLKGFGVDSMQCRSYVLIDIPSTVSKFQNMEVFGAGANCGLGMGVTPSELVDNGSVEGQPDKASAIIDLMRGAMKNAFGGSYEEGITRRTVVNVPAGSTIQLDSIFGGAYGADPMYPCDVYEAQVNYHSEKASTGIIFGGNNSADRTLYGQVNIDVPVWSDKKNGYLATVFGAGFGAGSWSQYTEVNLLPGAKVYEVYGGGKSGQVLNSETMAKWRYNEGADLDLSLPGYEDKTTPYTDKDGETFYLDAGLNSPLAHAVRLDGQKYNTNVHIHKNATVVGYAYGGGLGADAVVSGTTYIDLLGGTVTKDLYAAGTSGSVEDHLKAGTFTARSTAYIEGGTVRNVYGGGWEGHVGYHDTSTTATTDDILGETNVVIGIRKDQPEADLLAALQQAKSGATLADYGFYIGQPAIQRNAYGGGEGGSVFGQSHLTLNGGYIGYVYNTSTNAFEEKIHDETWTDHIGLNRLSDCGNLFGGGYDDNSSVDETNVTVYGGTVRNCVFGGGEIATIGRGKMRESGEDNKIRVLDAIYKTGGTRIEIFNGLVKRNVFGGGKGYNILGYGGIHGFYTDGYVFGQTEIHVHGGEVGTAESVANGDGNVFGGGDVGYVYGKGYFYSRTTSEKAANPGGTTGSPNHWYYYSDASGEEELTEDCKVVVAPMLQVKPDNSVTFNGVTYGPYEYVPTDYLNTLPSSKTDSRWAALFTGDKLADGSINPDDPVERGVHIHNAVFGGGNVSSNSESYNNATTVFGNTTATLYDVYHRDFITVGTEHTGGLYGGGNLSVVDGYRELNITNYGTDYYGMNEQISLETYQTLTNRERAYFRLEYLCQQTYGEYKAGQRISEDEYNKLPSAYQNEDYWKMYGFCSIYAGRLLNTIQRADFCGVYGSRLVLQGAKDRVADVADATEYTINRIGEVSLNQQRSVAGDTEEKHKLHGNYFGIYSIVNYLGSLTSDVHFSDKRRYDNKGVTEEDTKTYYQFKYDNKTKRERNNGTSFNQVALASGVFLELTSEKSTSSNKIYGEITGVVELDLINVKKDIEGGGYVYAKNEHGTPTYHSNYQNLLLSEYNKAAYRGTVQLRDSANTHKSYTYDTSTNDLQMSGNFIHKSKRIVDECYPNNGDITSPAHYWYIKGEVYIYDQLVSAYAGSATAYSKEVKIPLTITAGANGRLQLLNIQPNRYAYYADGSRDESKKITADGVTVDNESVTYYLNDVITWWDWHQLSDNEKRYFVRDTYVNVDSCNIDGKPYPAGTYVLENDTILHAATAWKTFQESSHIVLNAAGTEVTDLTTLFHSSNNISHDTGYALTLDMNSPKDWGDWYTPIDSNSGLRKIRKDAYDALSKAEQDNYREGPTYTLKPGEDSGLYGQRMYAEGEIISEETYKDYTTTVAVMDPKPTGQATVENAYVALADVGTVQAGSAISETAFNALSDKSNYAPAMVCVNTIQLGDEDFVLMGELVSGTDANLAALAAKYKKYNNDKINADPVDDDQALEYVTSHLSNAYYITSDGLYGGQYFQSGINYATLKSWCELTESRDKFTYNYDALDVLIDPKYHGEDHIDTYYHSPYSDVKSVEYDAAYTGGTSGTETLTYTDGSGTERTLSQGDVISSTDYENYVPNEQLHYTRIPVEMGSDTQTAYIVTENIVNHGTPYAKGQDISEKDFNSLTDENKDFVATVVFQKDPSKKQILYYCLDDYTPSEDLVTVTGTAGAAGSVISDLTFLEDVPNKQKDFTIQGAEPTETTTLYVSRESNAKDVTSEKVISVVYQYTYYEADDEGEGVSLVNELHVVNIHLKLESGAPEIGPLSAPPAVLPGNTVGLKAPSVNPGLYEVLTSGWELFNDETDAMYHRNGVPFTNNGTKLYWYQNQNVWLAFYSKTYLGKTYSNYVPLTVANYHDLDAVMADKDHHLYVDHPYVERNSKIYIDNRDCESDATKSELDLLKDFFDLSVNSGSAAVDPTTGLITSGPFAGHAPLDDHVKGGADLDFILNSNVSPKAYTVSGGSPDGWTPIGTDTQCFEGTLHGDGYTISGLDHSLFGTLCGDVYNLGVTGSYTSAGVADTGKGYVENCWINTSATSGFPAGTRAVFGNPTRDSGTQIANCYYPATKAYSTTNNGRGLATPMTDTQFYNGTVAFNLNGFYLNKRYYDHTVPSGSPTEYNYLRANSNGTLPDEMSTGKYPETPDGTYCDLGYVESRYTDGDFIYAGGTIPEAYDDRMRLVHDGTTSKVVYAPIWPDDYIFFGQTLTYDYNTSRPHDSQPTHIAKSSGRLPISTSSNRVYRAPAYYQSKDMGVCHFNLAANLAAYSMPESPTDDKMKSAYPNMTAIDFCGHNDTSYKQGLNGKLFYQPILDNDEGLLSIANNYETPNLLVYAPVKGKNATTDEVLSSYFTEPAFEDYYTDDDYRCVAPAPTSSIHGHLVQSNLKATADQLLVDKRDFNCPISYSFDKGKYMWYQRTPDRFVSLTKGWETVSLPFTAELVTTQQKGEITHFYSASRSVDENGTKIGHEYWLREYKGRKDLVGDTFVAAFNYPTANGGYKTVGNTFLWDYYYKENSRLDANQDSYQRYYETSRSLATYPLLAAGTPYIIGFPGKTYYEFDLSGEWTAKNTAGTAPAKLDKQTVSFVSEPAITIGVSDDEQTGTPLDGYTFMANYSSKAVTGYMLNTDGDRFKVTTTATDLVPFRPYFVATSGSSSAPARKSVQTILFDNDGSSFAFGDEDPTEGEIGEGLLIAVKGHTVSVRSALREATDVRIINVSGITHNSFTLQPGETVNTFLPIGGVYIVRAANGRYQQKLVVK